MLNKKSQVTFFIILAIIVFAVAVLIIFLYPSLLRPEEKTLAPVVSYLETCIKQHATEGIFLLGKQGGYYNTSGPFGYYYEVIMVFYFVL